MTLKDEQKYGVIFAVFMVGLPEFDTKQSCLIRRGLNFNLGYNHTIRFIAVILLKLAHSCLNTFNLIQ